MLVNNAGMSPLYPSLVEVGEGLWDKVFGVNIANSWTSEFSAALSAQSALARTGAPDEIVGAWAANTV